ncbi:hypothetical protein PE067_06335 [Paracoccus sp. DMF-8]|uniref:hypothetical protein n=1 Tax=Paracoccus sp. DMF-8 TaxID=3019445 RepID=UPI0023E88B7B|nr:hypothetical protein [Paracoccus sp. DMF-8]MDF3605796.1 hypothetical protein [Paracoccus sp. DMF-8]
MWGELPALDSAGNLIDYPRSFSHAPDWAYWASRQTSVVGKLAHDFDNGWQAEATLGATWRRYDAELLYMWDNPDPVTGEGLGYSAWGGTERTKLLSFDAKATGPVELWGRTHQLNLGVSTDRDWTGATGLATAANWPRSAISLNGTAAIRAWTGTPNPTRTGI